METEVIDPRSYFHDLSKEAAFEELVCAGIYVIEWDDELDSEFGVWQYNNLPM